MAKKFFWLKLKEDFFADDAIEWLEDQPNGKEYVLFYLKLCLKALKTEGILIRSVGTMLVPYDVQKLAQITKTDFDTAAVAINLLRQIGLVEQMDKGELFLPALEQMVGSETQWAKYKRKGNELENFQPNSNERILENLQSDSNMEGLENLQCGSNDIPKNLQTEIRDRDRDKEIEKEKDIVEPPAQRPSALPGKPVEDKHPVGGFEYQCVEMLISSCVAILPNAKVPKTPAEMKKWAVEIERMKRLDNRTEEEIIEALTYATTDAFWKPNIRSTKKFREKFETLLLQSRAKSNKALGGGGSGEKEGTEDFLERLQRMRGEL